MTEAEVTLPAAGMTPTGRAKVFRRRGALQAAPCPESTNASRVRTHRPARDPQINAPDDRYEAATGDDEQCWMAPTSVAPAVRHHPCRNNRTVATR
jgi:hypothetical protein